MVVTSVREWGAIEAVAHLEATEATAVEAGAVGVAREMVGGGAPS